MKLLVESLQITLEALGRTKWAYRSHVEDVWLSGVTHVESLGALLDRTVAVVPFDSGGGVVYFRGEDPRWIWVAGWAAAPGELLEIGVHRLVAIGQVLCMREDVEGLVTDVSANPTKLYHHLGWTEVGEDLWAVRYASRG